MEWRLSSLLVPFSTLLKHALSTTLIVSRSSVSLSYKVLGDSEMDVDEKAPPLFLFHGLLGNKRHWESMGKTLLHMTKRSVVVVDLRNHGDSPHNSSHRYDELAEDVIRLLKRLSVNRACLLGHSMGGRTCMCVSLLAVSHFFNVTNYSLISIYIYLIQYKQLYLNEQGKVISNSQTVIKILSCVLFMPMTPFRVPN